MRSNRYLPDSTTKLLMPNIILVEEFTIGNENGDEKRLLALADQGGFIVTYMELLEILNAIHGFYNDINDAAIDKYNESLLSNYHNRNVVTETQVNRKLEQSKRNGYVYLINAGEFYKIGISRNVDRRITQLSTIPPFDVTLVCTIETDDMLGLENELHTMFSEKRVNGEWFTLSAEDVNYIIELSLERA